MSSRTVIDRVMRIIAPPRVYRVYRRGWQGSRPAHQIISFPKCGRTWLRMLLGKALWEMAGRPDESDVAVLLNLSEATRLLHSRDIVLAHDDNPQWKTPAELDTDKSKYAAHKVALLVRDPRDVIVSLFFEHTKRVDLYSDLVKKDRRMAAYRDRIHRYEGDLAAFIREEVGSTASFIEYLNIWERNRTVPRGLLFVRYEDLHADAAHELRRVLAFFGFSSIPDDVIERSVAFCHFEKMHRIEATAPSERYTLRAADVTDAESFKTRRGKIGGYRDYLSTVDIAWMDALINERLAPAFDAYKTSAR
jgi:hypothetical protein